MIRILKDRLKDPIFRLGLITLFFWLVDTYSKIFLKQSPVDIFWYSSLGLLSLTIGLLWRNSFILSSMFCALGLIETVWIMSFFSNLLFHHNALEVADYAFMPEFTKTYFIFTLYHFLLAPAVFYGVWNLKHVSKWGFVGAGCFALTSFTLAAIFSNPAANINCVFRSCHPLTDFLFYLPIIPRILIGTVYVTMVLYLPSNYLLLLWEKRTIKLAEKPAVIKSS